MLCMLYVIKISNDVDNVLQCHSEISSTTVITKENSDASADTKVNQLADILEKHHIPKENCM